MIDKRISHRLKLLLYGCRILWKVSPKYYIAIVLLGILGGIVAPLIAIVWQQSLDVIALMLQTRDISMSIFLLLFLYSSLVFLTSLIAESLRYCKQTYSDMVKVSITNSILRKCTNYSMETYDDPEFYDYLMERRKNMKIVDPMRNPDAVAASTCACICDTGSAYWKASGENYSSHCGCQCIEGNTANTSANLSTATAKA